MSGFRSFEEMQAWQAARRLNQRLWALIEDGAFGRDFPLVDQVNPAAGPATDNIAEGFDSGSKADFVGFLPYAQRSSTKLKSQMDRALNRGHLITGGFEALEVLYREVANKGGGLIRFLTLPPEQPKSDNG